MLFLCWYHNFNWLIFRSVRPVAFGWWSTWEERYGRNPFSPLDCILFSLFRVHISPGSGIVNPFGCSSRFSDEHVTQTGSMRFNLGTFKTNFLLLARETLFLLDLKLPGATVKGRPCVRMNPIRRKGWTWRRIYQNPDDLFSHLEILQVLWPSAQPLHKQKLDLCCTRTSLTAPAKPPKIASLLVISLFSWLTSLSSLLLSLVLMHLPEGSSLRVYTLLTREAGKCGFWIISSKGRI